MSRPRALVTGGSSGIGEAFARQLAGRGYDLLLVARGAGQLERLAEELAAASNIDVEVLPADLSVPDQLATVEARASAPARPLDLLVNSAGYASMGRFCEMDLPGELGQVELNVVAIVALTHAALRSMVPRRAGGIINVGSVAGFMPTPGWATYAATKAFILSFSEALHEEVAPLGVSVTCICPGYTPTGFQGRAGAGMSERAVPKLFQTSAAAVAEAGLAAHDRNKAVEIPAVADRTAVTLIGLMPRAVVRRTMAKLADYATRDRGS